MSVGASWVAVFLPVIVGLVWGCTNPFVKRGVARAEAKPSIHSWTLVRYITTPAYIVPQSLNLGASVLFSWGLSLTRVSAAAPVANGLSIASNAVVDHALGDRLSGGRACLGVVLVSVGAVLCSLSAT